MLAPLFSALGPEPVRERMRLGEAAVLVMTPELCRRKVAPIRDSLPALREVLLVGGEPEPATVELPAALAASSPEFEIQPTDPEDMALLHFTSGTTGKPKGAVDVHGAVVAHHVTAAYALDLRLGDVFWCTADPGWVTGTSYGIIASLTHGATLVSDEGEFAARRWYRVLADQRVTVWYTAPTTLRMLMRRGPDLAGEYDLSALRYVASVGEPLNPEVVVWGQDTLGLPVHDNWWQIETDAIMISNFRSADVRPGSMGRPLPGIEAGLLERGEDGRARVVAGRIREVTEPVVEGELDGWYLSGDVARRDADGHYWPGRRRDQVRRPPRRAVRGGERSHGPSRRGGGRGDRQAGSGGERACSEHDRVKVDQLERQLRDAPPSHTAFAPWSRPSDRGRCTFYAVLVHHRRTSSARRGTGAQGGV